MQLSMSVIRLFCVVFHLVTKRLVNRPALPSAFSTILNHFLRCKADPVLLKPISTV